MNNSTRIANAIDRTCKVIPGYFEKTLAQRAGLSETAAGSIYESVNVHQLERMLLNASWEEYSHPAVMPGCVAFKAPIPGTLGIVELRSIVPDNFVKLDDRKGTGQVSCVVSGSRGETVDFTVIILGDENGEEVVFTFHPGDPVRPSQIQVEPGMHGKQITVSEAISMGLETAKIE
jgi:hypothetical protein